MIFSDDLGVKGTAATLLARDTGLAVLPTHTVEAGVCGCGQADCPSPGKHPIGRLVPNGSRSASRDFRTVANWWTFASEANIGIATGGDTSPWVLDADGADGIGDLEALVAKHGPLPETVTAATGGGGRHLYFAPDDRVRCKTWLHNKPIDCRGDGGYVLAAPSDHLSGQSYRWLRSPFEIDVAVAPPWLLEWVLDTMRTPTEKAGTGLVIAYQGSLEDHAGVAKGERNATLCRLAGEYLRRQDWLQQATELALAWNQRCDPPERAEAVIKVVRAIWRKEFQARRGMSIPAERPARSDALEPWPLQHTKDQPGLAKVAQAKSGQRDRAVAWLRETLGGGPLEMMTIKTAIGGLGIGLRTVERAKAALGVLSRRRGKGWEWYLPEQGDCS